MEGRCLVNDAHGTCGFEPAAAAFPATRSRLVDALEGPDVESALERAMARLRAGGDVQLLLAMAGALVRLGLAGLAVRLLMSTRVPVFMRDELRALARELAALPSGETPSTKLADRYRANAAALRAGRPQFEAVAPSQPPELDGVHLFRTPAGNVHAVRDDPAGRLHLIFPFVNHHREAEMLTLGPVREGSAVLSLGVPSPPLLQRILALRTASGFRPPIDIIEPDPRVLAVWLHLADMAHLLGDLRVGIFAGADALQQYERFRADHLWRQEPTLTLKNHRPDWRAESALGDVPAFHERVRIAVQTRQRALFGRQAAHYALCTAESWAARFREAANGGPPLRVLHLATRYSTVTRHAMRDLAAAFRRRGCEADVVTEPHDCSGRIDTWSLLADRPCDLVIVLNHLHGALADQIHPKIPFVCWIQDYMPELWSDRAGPSVGELHLVIGRDRGILTTLHEYPPDRFIAAGNLTDPQTYSAEPVEDRELAPFRCDVSYVSHASATPEQMIEEIVQESGPALGAYFSRILALLRRRLAAAGFVSLIDTYAFMLRAERESDDVSFTPAERKTGLHPVVLGLFDRLFRHEALEWVATWADARGRSLKLFGRGWEYHPTLHRFGCGEIDNGYEIRCACQASRINLQINGYNSLHQRLLDSLACGGFVLTRFNPNDFIRRPMLELQRIIRQKNVANLRELLEPTGPAPEAAECLETLRRLRQPRIALAGDPARRREIELMREAGAFPAERLTDEALFESIRSQRYLPHRLAGDIPGFARTTFADCRTFHAMLDHYVDDDRARRVFSQPMRRDALAHDTHDLLVERIIDHFASLSGRGAPLAPPRRSVPASTGGS
jgi:hypothetical protein